MPKRFLTPGTMSQEELSEYVQPSWGTILGKSIGQGVSGLAGTFDRRMEQSRRDALALQKQRALYERQRDLASYKHELGEPGRVAKEKRARAEEVRRDARAERARAEEVRKDARSAQAAGRSKIGKEAASRATRAEMAKKIKAAGKAWIETLAGPYKDELAREGIPAQKMWTTGGILHEAGLALKEMGRLQAEGDMEGAAKKAKQMDIRFNSRLRRETDARIKGGPAHKSEAAFKAWDRRRRAKLASDKENKAAEERDLLGRKKSIDEMKIASAAIKVRAKNNLSFFSKYKSIAQFEMKKESTLLPEMLGGAVTIKDFKDEQVGLLFGDPLASNLLSSMTTNSARYGLDMAQLVRANPAVGFPLMAQWLARVERLMSGHEKFDLDKLTIGQAMSLAAVDFSGLAKRGNFPAIPPDAPANEWRDLIPGSK